MSSFAQPQPNLKSLEHQAIIPGVLYLEPLFNECPFTCFEGTFHGHPLKAKHFAVSPHIAPSIITLICLFLASPQHCFLKFTKFLTEKTEGASPSSSCSHCLGFSSHNHLSSLMLLCHEQTLALSL